MAAVLLLRMLLTWMHGCPPAVSAFLSAPAHLHTLLDILATRSDGDGDVAVPGLAALLLGVCVVFNDSSGAGLSLWPYICWKFQGSGGLSLYLILKTVPSEV